MIKLNIKCISIFILILLMIVPVTSCSINDDCIELFMGQRDVELGKSNIYSKDDIISLIPTPYNITLSPSTDVFPDDFGDFYICNENRTVICLIYNSVEAAKEHYICRFEHVYFVPSFNYDTFIMAYRINNVIFLSSEEDFAKSFCEELNIHFKKQTYNTKMNKKYNKYKCEASISDLLEYFMNEGYVITTVNNDISIYALYEKEYIIEKEGKQLYLAIGILKNTIQTGFIDNEDNIIESYYGELKPLYPYIVLGEGFILRSMSKDWIDLALNI